MEIRKFIQKTVKNFLTENYDKNQFYRDAYFKAVNKKRDGFLNEVSNNPNFFFLITKDFDEQKCGSPNKCETNVYDFIKEKMKKGEDYYFPVGGFMFTCEILTPIEHWWVYNKKTDSHIEITPMEGDRPCCYAGVVNYKINDKILNSNIIWDVDFFKSGNVYSAYFK